MTQLSINPGGTKLYTNFDKDKLRMKSADSDCCCGNTSGSGNCCTSQCPDPPGFECPSSIAMVVGGVSGEPPLCAGVTITIGGTFTFNLDIPNICNVITPGSAWSFCEYGAPASFSGTTTIDCGTGGGPQNFTPALPFGGIVIQCGTGCGTAEVQSEATVRDDTSKHCDPTPCPSGNSLLTVKNQPSGNGDCITCCDFSTCLPSGNNDSPNGTYALHSA